MEGRKNRGDDEKAVWFHREKRFSHHSKEGSEELEEN